MGYSDENFLETLEKLQGIKYNKYKILYQEPKRKNIPFLRSNGKVNLSFISKKAAAACPEYKKSIGLIERKEIWHEINN